MRAVEVRKENTVRAMEVRKEITVRATGVRKKNTVRATEGMEKMAENAMVKKVATSYCCDEEGNDG